MEYLRMSRTLRRITMGIVGLLLLYLLCLLYPQPFFPFKARRGNITIYASRAVPSSLFDEVNNLLRRSPLDDTTITQRVFVCGSVFQFGFFTRGRTNLGGLCDNRLTRNIFIRPASPDFDRVPGDPRPLSYFIAHEITHSLESHYVGRWSLREPTWLWEGYADYIGDPRSISRLLDVYRARSPQAYDRYALYVTYLLDLEHQDIRDLLRRPPARDSVEAAVQGLAR
ncbi:hypothetical protein [Dinghuibacter silviterrae]|uniref:Uncharacterized protein n=1 Tax=Dinghuibacter silviterrae TaxID=1539049 RepID=A0A4R8DID6_9BACT|nr:hypothetical protein [Dinghuibacter silviterrae]TDW97258.1 hypothetical protein EDB95_5105 [Dinghuibacter silviterrae]